MIIFLNDIDEKITGRVLDFLSESLIEYEVSSSAFNKLCKDEARYILLESEVINEDIQKKVNSLPNDRKETLISNIANSYENSDGIIDYEYMRDLLDEEVYLFFK